MKITKILNALLVVLVFPMMTTAQQTNANLVVTIGLYAKQPEGYTIPQNYVNFDAPFFRDSDFGIRTFVTVVDSTVKTDLFGDEIKTSVFATSAGLGGLYYFNKILKLDKNKYHLYGGVAAIYTTATATTSSNSSYLPSSSATSSDFDVVFQAGGKYFIGKSKRFGINAEIDFKKEAAFKAGICYIFKL